MDAISKLAFRIFGSRLEMEKYYSLERSLRQARIPVSWDVYVAKARLYSLILGFLGAVIGLTLVIIVIHLVGLPPAILPPAIIVGLPPALWWMLEYRAVFLALFLMVTLATIVGGATYMIMRLMPQFVAGERKIKIDRELPYAVTFMYALSRGGMNILDIFRSLSESTIYGEAAKEAGTIVRNMDFFGQDLRTAIQNAADTSPSENFQDLVVNLLSVIESGGNITAYLSDKSEDYLEKALRDQRGFIEMMGLIAESYVTVFVAGPLFVVIIFFVMAAMGPGDLMMLYILIYAALPFGSCMFIVIIDMLNPRGAISAIPFDVEEVDEYKVQMAEGTKEERLLKSIESGRKSVEFKKFLSNPFKGILENPFYTLYLSVPIGIILLLAVAFTYREQLTTLDTAVSILDDYFIFTLLLVIFPLAAFFEASSRRQKKLVSEMPTFLKKLASANETGMSLPQSIKLISKSNIGSLTTEVKKIWNDLQWGTTVENAFKRLGNRIMSGPVSRVITLLVKANQVSGNTKVVLDIAAKDAVAYQRLEEEQLGQMIIYVVIIYMAFFVFLFVIVTMSVAFLPVMAGVGAADAGAPSLMGAFDVDMFMRIFFHAVIVQGFFSGLIAGQMGEGSVLSGLKHSIVMMCIAYLVFLFI
ncbi:MAG: type II secretion system F family protein [Methanosarcinales archaeon Met12]|nr:MAG: type II secretion system F family protein [Methanosarcinales archaeon Met12]